MAMVRLVGFLCPFRVVTRSIPIVSKLDFTNPVYSTHGNSCGTGDFAWNTVAESPFAKEVSVDTWDGLSALLDMLRNKPDDYILQLQVSRFNCFVNHAQKHVVEHSERVLQPPSLATTKTWPP